MSGPPNRSHPDTPNTVGEYTAEAFAHDLREIADAIEDGGVGPKTRDALVNGLRLIADYHDGEYDPWEE